MARTVNYWLTKYAGANVYIDRVNGNDQLNGLQSTVSGSSGPLRSWAELAARLPYFPQMTINIASTGLLTSDPINIFGSRAISGNVTIVGTLPAPALSGTLTGYTGAVRTIGAEATATATDSGATFTGSQGRLMIITGGNGGARTGAFWPIGQAPSSHVVQLAAAGIQNNENFNPMSQWSRVTPAAGDTYSVYDRPTVRIGTIAWFGPANLIFRNIDFDIDLTSPSAASIASVTSAGYIGFVGCKSNTHGGTSTGGISYSGHYHLGLTYWDGLVQCAAGWVNNYLSITRAAGGAIDMDTILWGNTVSVGPYGLFIASGFQSLGTIGFFQSGGFASRLNVGPGATAINSTVRDSTSLLWGNTNPGYGVQMSSESRLCYVNRPQVNSGLGTGRELSLGGDDVLWSQLDLDGAVNGSNGARVAPYFV